MPKHCKWNSPYCSASVRVSFDIECYSEHIKNSRVKHNDQVAKELGCLSKFYKLKKAGYQEPMVVMDCHSWILLWYLSARGAKYSKTGEKSTDELDHGLTT